MCRRFEVSGRVQGVGYRDFARRTARTLALRGSARNRPDGSVEVIVCGDAAALAHYATELRAGPRWSQVEAVSESASPCSQDEGFVIG